MLAQRRESDLVGRGREVNHLVRSLTIEEARVVTLWGPGGIGKTSLARVLAEKTAEFFTGGTELALLAGARDPVDLLATVAAALSLGDGPVSEASIGRALSARGKVLLLLDNVEQIVDAAASALATWRLMAPRATFLVTSRELLATPGETPFELLPLGAEAVDLLRLRARAVRPAFDADTGILQTIAERLDGIPLALELAAARLAVTNASHLLARLDDRFAVLRRDHGATPRRQRTLHGAIDWSWNLLSENERDTLAKLSAFRGFDLETAGALLGHDATDVVSALRHKSLVAEARGAEPRFFLLESIREFAAAALPERAREGAARHAEVFRARFESGASLAALTAEHDNLLAIAQAPAAWAVLALEPLLTARGAGEQLALLLERALAAEVTTPLLLALSSTRLSLGQLEAAGVAAERADARDARALVALGLVRQAQGRSDEALALTEKALAKASSGAVRGAALATMGLVLHTRGAFLEARGNYEAALTLLDGRLAARTHARLGFLLHDFGDVSGARAQYDEAARLDEAGVLEALLTGYLGNLERDARRTDAAIALYDRAIRCLQRVGDRRMEAAFTMDRGIAHLLARVDDAALTDLETAATIGHEIGDAWLTGLTLGYLVVLRAWRGELDAAEATERRRGEAAALFELHHAHILLARGEGLAEAKRLLARMGPAPHGQHRRLARSLLESATLRAAPPAEALVLRGRRMRVGPKGWRDLAPHASAVIALLVARRSSSPGAVVPSAELIAAGWPGEKLVAGAGPNRLRVLVSNLRASGLREVLESAGGGYRIAPSISVVSD